MGPHPPPGSGIHNYTFQLYQQTEKKDIKPLEGRKIEIEDLKNRLQVTNLLTQFVFKSQYESGGKNKKSKIKKRTRRRNKKTKRKI